ncbi:PREDICTED: zinc carboxypeptidase-like [Rhagoletis zephyria]|uniref:zinc carboxypeptidase-like n=1 Tax=Rhagoletis zephyria TaxID=28612 RepID=UPI000811AA52|nr:PREDICTED: zinc carboxypeptidase-like [Rhagoletis zephyria]
MFSKMRSINSNILWFIAFVALFEINAIKPVLSYEEGEDFIKSYPNIARYDHYRVYHVELSTEQHVALFQELEEKSDSCTFYGHARHPQQKLTIMVAAHKIADFADLLQTYKVNHHVLSYNFQEIVDRNLKEVLPKDINPRNMDWLHYFHLETIYSWMELLAEENPKDLTIINMGESAQGLPIKGLSLKKNKNNGTATIFVESGIHAREWIAPATANYIINELLLSNDTKIQKYANEYNWIIFPVVNPDGYKYTFEGDRMWRKNREIFGICRGVDLNRNYPFHWNTTGTSGDPCRYDYSGPAAASETETKRLIKFVQENLLSENIKTYIALHSYSQMIMFPYGHTADRVENYDDLTAIGKKASEKIKQVSGRIYKSGSIYETIYPSSGGSKDWAHGVLKIPITFSFELRGPPDSKDLFILQAAEIKPTAEEAFAAIITIVEESESRGYYSLN